MRRLFGWLDTFKLGKFFTWLDKHLLEIASGFLLALIPLYPKFPLFEVLPGYIVRVRLEDFFVATTILIWLIWLWRGKIKFGPNPLAKPLLLYLTIGFLSLVSALFITQTVPLQKIHVAKILLHFLRRVEYFSLFFIFFSTIRSMRQVKAYLGIFIFTIMVVTIYGYGQKYLYWPAFSTMNREFAKGWWLYLTEHARVLSTFGGHYDLAAFTMMALVFLWSLFFAFKKFWQKILIFAVLAGAFWLLILTASRTSFLAYLGAVSFAIFLFMFKKGLGWGISRWLAVMTLSILVMLSFGDLSERFTKILRIDERIGGLKSMMLNPKKGPPTQKAAFLENNLAAVVSRTDMPPTPVKPGTQPKPIDVFEDVPVYELATVGGQTRSVARPRTYSKAAMVFDLSTGIRLDVLWPQALKAFQKNPLLGTGYSTLNKTQVTQFTEAESTDNDYLRALGETGIVGFLAFFGTLIFIIYLVFRSLGGITDLPTYGLVVGLTAGIFGLLINAVYIDVFEASKVAFSFWALMGILLGTLKIQRETIEKNKKPLRIPFSWQKIKLTAFNFLKSDKFLILVLLVLAFAPRLYRINQPLADWHSWRQADTSAVTRNFQKAGGINFLYPTFDDLSSVASGKSNPRGLRFVEFPIYNAATVIFRKIVPEGTLEVSGRATSILFSLGSLIFLFLITRKYLGRRVAFLAGLFFALLPFNIYYSRTILPEPTLVFFSLGMVYFFDKWLESGLAPRLGPRGLRKNFLLSIFYLLLSIFFTAVALLVKPFAAFLFLPMFYLAWRQWGIRLVFRPSLYLYILISLAPFLWWRWWMGHFPEGIPASSWLFNSDQIRFKGAFFWWLFEERIGRLILGVWGVVFLVLGILRKRNPKEGLFFDFWLVSQLGYLTVLATGNVRHDYYQVIIIPIIAIFLAKGADFILVEGRKIFNFAICYLLFAFCFLFMLAFGWYQARDFFNINHPEIVEAGLAVDKIAPRQALVIAPYSGDTAFLYQTNRAGWPVMDEPLENLIARGADYFVSVDLKDKLTQELYLRAGKGNPYKVIESTPKYLIIQLVADKDLPKD